MNRKSQKAGYLEDFYYNLDVSIFRRTCHLLDTETSFKINCNMIQATMNAHNLQINQGRSSTNCTILVVFNTEEMHGQLRVSRQSLISWTEQNLWWACKKGHEIQDRTEIQRKDNANWRTTEKEINKKNETRVQSCM